MCVGGQLAPLCLGWAPHSREISHDRRAHRWTRQTVAAEWPSLRGDLISSRWRPSSASASAWASLAKDNQKFINSAGDTTTSSLLSQPLLSSRRARREPLQWWQCLADIWGALESWAVGGKREIESYEDGTAPDEGTTATTTTTNGLAGELGAEY